jgi:hypothetical protein
MLGTTAAEVILGGKIRRKTIFDETPAHTFLFDLPKIMHVLRIHALARIAVPFTSGM